MEDGEALLQSVFNDANGLIWWTCANPDDPARGTVLHHISCLLGRIALFDGDLPEASRLIQTALARDAAPAPGSLDWKFPREFLREVNARLRLCRPGSPEQKWYEGYRAIFCAGYVDAAAEKGLLTRSEASFIKAEVLAGRVPF